MKENTGIGKRTIFWMKASFAVALTTGILALILIFTNDVHALMEAPPNTPLPTSALFLLIAVLVGIVALGISASIAGIFWLFWLYRTTTNLRQVTSTKFSPWAAVICTCLPYLGYLLNFIIFRDLVKKQQCYLRSIHVDFPPVNLFLVNAWFLLTILSSVINIFSDSTMVMGLSIALAMAGFLCFIEAFKPYLLQEKMLYARYEEDRVRYDES